MESRAVLKRIPEDTATRFKKKRNQKQIEVILGSRILKIGSSEVTPSIKQRSHEEEVYRADTWKQ